MDIVFQGLLITHFIALVVGTATTVAMPVVMGFAPKAGADSRPAFAGIGKRLSLNARVAFGVLVLSGIAMMLVRYGGMEGMNGWFWAKMGLVVVVLAAMVAAVALKPGTLNPKVMGWITRLSILGIIVSAVLAFN